MIKNMFLIVDNLSMKNKSTKQKFFLYTFEFRKVLIQDISCILFTAMIFLPLRNLHQYYKQIIAFFNDVTNLNDSSHEKM